MFVLVAYDVSAGRTEKFRKLLSRYLVHEQNSVFCGLLGRPGFRELETGLKAAMTKGDRILILFCENRLNMNVTRLGSESDGIRIEKKSTVL